MTTAKTIQEEDRYSPPFFRKIPISIEKGSGIKFADMFHGHNERIPIAGLHWGTEVLDAVVREFAAQP